MVDHARSDIDAIGKTFGTLDIKPPKAVAEAVERHARLTNAQLGSPMSLADAVVDALDAGIDPLEDPVVRTIAVGQVIDRHGTREELKRLAEAQASNAIAENADAIVQAWRKPFDAAARDLVSARKVLGAVDLADAPGIAAKGEGAPTAWGSALEANATIGTIRFAWQSLHRLVPGRARDSNLRLLTIADVDAETWHTEGLRGSKLDAWQATVAGYELSLPTLSEFRQRAKAVNAYSSAPERAGTSEGWHRTFAG